MSDNECDAQFFATNDVRLKTLGEIISSDSNRMIILLSLFAILASIAVMVTGPVTNRLVGKRLGHKKSAKMQLR